MELMEAVKANDITTAQQAEILAALESKQQMDAIKAAAAAIDWTAILKLLSLVAQFIPGLAPVVAIINAVINAIPNIVPPNNGGGSDTIPTPH